jgi:hypothetical protein
MSSQLQVTGEAKIRDIQGPVVANSGVITALDGAASQYVRGDGTLADFPTSTGGGSSVSYYLNSSVSQGTIGGVAYRELSKDPIIGAGTDIAISTTGYVASYITDANDPDVVIVPGGNFNCEFYFSVNNNTGNPTTYAELYKYDGTTFTLLGSSVGVPESINQGTTIAPYYFAIPVATAALATTDRLAIRIYVNVDGRTVTLHTENGHLCQVVTTLSKGMVSLNNLTDQSQFLTTGTSGTDFNIVSTGDTHTFNLPITSATNTGKLSSTDWTTFNNKQNAITLTTTGTSGAATLVGATLNIPNYTTDLSGYLPLTGGTLTGALNGTSASFSGNITSNLSLLVNRIDNGDYLALKIENRPITAGNTASGFIAFYSNSGDATNNTYSSGRIYSRFDTNSYNSARISLATVTGNEIYQDVLTAKDTNVGIGTINPAQTLHLFTTSGTGSGVGTAIQIQSAGTGADQGWIGVNKGTGNGLTLSVQTNNIIFNTGASTPFGGTERMRVTNGGDVGIGIISPLYKLDVDGTGRFSNTLYIGSSTGFISDAMLVAQINTPVSSDRYFAVNNNGAYGLVMGYTTTSGRARIANISNSPMTLETNNIVALTLAANQTATFASSVTATSIIKTGGTSSQFLMADGSVNTSVLPSGAYLPLTGGTLTGALSGTTATFSSSVTANSLIKTGGTSAQILAADGSVITAGTNITISGGTISSTGAITGSGTTNYIPKFTGASSIGNSLIFDNGTNIGIGLTSPSYKLDVQDNGVSGIVDVSSFSVTGNGGSGRGVGILLGAAGSSNSVQVARLVGYQELANPVAVAASFAIQVANSSGVLTERLRVTQAGNLIIGTTGDAGFKLNVNGTGNFTGALSGTSATFSDTITSTGNAATTTAHIFNNTTGSSGTAQYYADFKAGATLIGRILRGNGASGYEANGLNIDNFAGMQIKLNALGGSAGTFAVTGGAATFSSSVSRMMLFNSTNASGPYLGFQLNGADEFYIGKSNAIGGGTGFYDIYANASGGGLRFFTNGNASAAMLINTSGNVGIGTSSPDNYYSTKLVVAVGDENGITIAGTGDNFLMFADGQTGLDRYRGFIHYSHDSNFLAFGSDATERMRITSGGNVLIGQTAASGTSNGIYLRVGIESGFIVTNDVAIQLARYSSNGDIQTFYRDNTKVGSISVTTATTSYNVTSDYRLKEDLKEIKGLEKLSAIKVYDFKWKADGSRMDGVIAHELAEVIPYAVQGEKDAEEMQSVDYSKIVPVLVKAIQEQTQIIKDLEARIVSLESK